MAFENIKSCGKEDTKMEGKFAGVGLGNIFIIWLCCMVFTLGAKIIAARYPVKGLSEVIMVGA